MKIVKRVIFVALLCVIAFSVLCNVQAAGFSPSDMMGLVNNQADAEATDNVTTAVTNVSGAVITIARVISAAVAVAMLAIVGMKYMSAAPSEKADIKKHAVVYIVGAVIMFACTGILGIIQKFAASI